MCIYTHIYVNIYTQFHICKQCAQFGLSNRIICESTVVWEGWALTLGHLCGKYNLLVFSGPVKCLQQDRIVQAALSRGNSEMEFAAHIDEFSCLNQLTPGSPYEVHPSSLSFCWALPGRCIGNEVVVCRQLFVGRASRPRAF